MENVKNGNSDDQALKDILRESQEMQMKAAEIEGEFTKEQKKRYVEITQKMFNPVMDLH